MHAAIGYLHATALSIGERITGDERGQGTVEYVGLILLVSMLMVGMVVAMRTFNGSQGNEIAEAIIGKIKQAVQAISFK